MQDIHDIAPPVMVGMDPGVVKGLMVMTLGLVIAGVALGLFWMLKRHWNKKKTENMLMLPPPLPPDQAALKALALLGPPGSQPPRQIYFTLTAILKTFMGKQFHMGIPEMTTQEVLACLPRLNLEKSLVMQVRSFFQDAAMVKYAGSIPDDSRMQQDHAFVKDFILSVARAGEDPGHGKNGAPRAVSSGEFAPATLPLTRGMGEG